MIIVADASPLIFLGKIGQLGLIRRLFPGTVLVPKSVRDEILAEPIAPAEEQVLAAFLKTCSVERVLKPKFHASGLSVPDNEALTMAVRHRASFLLSDDRLLRQMAVVEGIRPMGTLGILLRSMDKGMLTRGEARQLLEILIQQHRFRISIEVYDATLQRMGV